MLCEYSHTKSESLAQIRTLMAEIQHFSRGLFFIGAPCRVIIKCYTIKFDTQRHMAVIDVGIV